MTAGGDEELAALIVREQRGFRRILYAGLVTLLLMAVMSAGLGVYLYIASQSLAETSERLQRNAFETRRRVDTQNNRIVAQDIAIRRAYDEMRRAGGGGDVQPTPANIAAAQAAARNFLLRGRVPTLADLRLLEQFSVAPEAAESQPLSASPPQRAAAAPAGLTPASRALLAGVLTLVEYEARGEDIPARATALPASLTAAQAAFQSARSDPTLAPLANVGIAWVAFEDASSQRSNYAAASCDQVFAAVAASAEEGGAAPMPLYWRAQCERKLGQTREALSDYARALRASAAYSSGDAADLTLAMNAFHGVGTTLIAGAAIPDDAPGMREALAIANEACPRRPAYARRTARMALALSCLDEGIDRRRALGQTDNQISGSAENISFAHLRDGDFDAAYANAAAVERTGLFAWNEAVRALAASRANTETEDERRDAATAAADARRNVAMFTVGQFNLCELQVLLSAQMYEDMREIIAETHPRAEVGCPPAP